MNDARVLVDAHDRAELIAGADSLPCAQCGAQTPAASIVIVETTEHYAVAPESEVDAFNDWLEGQGRPRAVGGMTSRLVHITGICPTCAEHVPRPATD
jgi:hypothetical protein